MAPESAALREALEHTGHLYTKDPQDVGHISESWRKRILELCDALDAAPFDVGVALRREKAAHAQTHAALVECMREIAALEQRLASEQDAHTVTLEKARGAERLIEDALPRMRTLNNAMSPGWLARADEFLGR